ncbi:hypothetical protein [Arthrobacter oryzae]|uniref:Uncharacterized protein n=1 Tax=Arthrobacter oryzae TaxID=409290 RepID=A0A3N0BMB2_9MICC|nr:hypothetical protein [Arthrobacter oryzae]RNL49903.1 hypothetical protein D7003_17385 [Arthrobacter oryzae]
MNTGFLGVGPYPEEVLAVVPGDTPVRSPDVVMDRGFELPAPPDAVWPWVLQLGRKRSGWYLPRRGGTRRPAPAARTAAH